MTCDLLEPRSVDFFHSGKLKRDRSVAFEAPRGLSRNASARVGAETGRVLPSLAGGQTERQSWLIVPALIVMLSLYVPYMIAQNIGWALARLVMGKTLRPLAGPKKHGTA